MSTNKNILNALNKIDRPGQVCVSENIGMVIPGLTVAGVGEIALPLQPSQAKQLIKYCHQAPYGKGIDTVVDTKVRNTWELDQSEFTLNNPNWTRSIDDLTRRAQKALGLEDRELKAHPYKLLIYEKGGFFLPHRDGEKLDQMVATLVVVLPSVYGGGELIVYHGDEQYSMELEGAKSGYEISYAAFYADCQHEIKPLTSGYRLCLTYNLTLEKSNKIIRAPSWDSVMGNIQEQLEVWFTENQTKAVILLDHQYTEKGLLIDQLKGLDYTKAEVLFDMATQSDYVAHLALVTLWQSGSAEVDGYDYYDNYGDDDGDYEMGEIFDNNLSINHWSDATGQSIAFDEIEIAESEIITEEEITAREPDNEEFEGYTGNAGMTLDRWYHRAAIVLWPRKKHFDVLCEMGTSSAITSLQLLMNDLKTLATEKQRAQSQKCQQFATAIIDTWHPSQAGWEAKNSSEKIFIRLLRELDNTTLAQQFLSKAMPNDSAIQLNNSFCQWLKKKGWQNFSSELQKIINNDNLTTVNRNAKLVEILCQQKDKNAERITLCQQLTHLSLKRLKTLDRKASEGHNWEIRNINRTALLSSLIKAMLAVDAEQDLSALIQHLLKNEQHYHLIKIQLNALAELKEPINTASSDAISLWLNHCRKALEKRTLNEPQPPKDQQRKATLSCQCADCQMLSTFLADPNKPQARFPLAKARRQHLHQMINRNNCDLTHETERVGRPFTLVCTKTTASYTAAKNTYQQDKKHLDYVISLQ